MKGARSKTCSGASLIGLGVGIGGRHIIILFRKRKVSQKNANRETRK